MEDSDDDVFFGKVTQRELEIVKENFLSQRVPRMFEPIQSFSDSELEISKGSTDPTVMTMQSWHEYESINWLTDGRSLKKWNNKHYLSLLNQIHRTPTFHSRNVYLQDCSENREYKVHENFVKELAMENNTCCKTSRSNTQMELSSLLADKSRNEINETVKNADTPQRTFHKIDTVHITKSTSGTLEEKTDIKVEGSSEENFRNFKFDKEKLRTPKATNMDENSKSQTMDKNIKLFKTPHKTPRRVTERHYNSPYCPSVKRLKEIKVSTPLPAFNNNQSLPELKTPRKSAYIKKKTNQDSEGIVNKILPVETPTNRFARISDGQSCAALNVLPQNESIGGTVPVKTRSRMQKTIKPTDTLVLVPVLEDIFNKKNNVELKVVWERSNNFVDTTVKES